MTIVCCWLDQSYARQRLTAIADGRAAVKVDGEWVPLSDTTIKLFRVPVKCHSVGSLNPDVAAWIEPYYQTEIGIGFAGYCFEGLTLIALLSRTLEQLAIEGENLPKPEPDGICRLAGEIMDRYFTEHRNPDQQAVEIIIFGFCSIKREPWVATLVHKARESKTIVNLNMPVTDTDFFAIGDVGKSSAFQSKLEEIRSRIAAHRDKIKKDEISDAEFGSQLEIARHRAADKKIIEELTLEKLGSEFSGTVGGVLQKVELYCLDEFREILSFSRDDRAYLLDGLPCVTRDGLGYVPIGEKMGRK